MSHDPGTVACPDCQAAVGDPCRMGNPALLGEAHAARVDAARLRAVDHGHCALCGRPMVRATDPDDAWHPDPTDATWCPQMGDPDRDWPAYAMNVNLGLSPGHPGPEHFRPGAPEAPYPGLGPDTSGYALRSKGFSDPMRPPPGAHP